MYFDWRLFGMTRGVRGRIALAAVLGLAGVPVALWRLALQGQAMARVFGGDAFRATVGMLGLIAGLVLLRATLQHIPDTVGHTPAADVKRRVRALPYEHH